MENKVQNHVVEKKDEIDLVELINIFGKLFFKIISQIKRFYSFVKRNLLKLLLFFVLGSIIGLCLSFISKPKYFSEALFNINDPVIRNDYVKSLIKDLNKLVKEKNNDLLAAKLNVDPSIPKEICEITFKHFNLNIAEDSITQGLPFIIDLKVYDNKILDTMNIVLKTFLENNVFFDQQKELRLLKLNSLISKLDNDLVQLDSLKRYMGENLYPRGKNNGLVFGEPVNPIEAYSEAITLFEKLVNLKTELRKPDSFYLVKEFTPSKNRGDFGVIELALLFGGICSFISLFFLKK